MLAFPVNSDKENGPISPLFGKANFFVIYSDKKEVVQTPQKGGKEVVEWLASIGVKDIIIKECGSGAYEQMEKSGLNIYYSGKDKVLTDELIELYNNKELELLTSESISKIIEKHENSHSHSHSH